MFVFVFGFLFLGLVCADLDIHHAFFANIDDILVPLARETHPAFIIEDSVFAYGNPMMLPEEFVIAEDHVFKASLESWGYVGYYQDYFVYGPSYEKQALNVTFESGYWRGDFFSCEVFPGSERHWISRKPMGGDGLTCFPVDVYLLPYDSERQAPVYGVTVPDRDQEYVAEDDRNHMVEIELSDNKFGAPYSPNKDWECLPEDKFEVMTEIVVPSRIPCPIYRIGSS